MPIAKSDMKNNFLNKFSLILDRTRAPNHIPIKAGITIAPDINTKS